MGAADMFAVLCYKQPTGEGEAREKAYLRTLMLSHALSHSFALSHAVLVAVLTRDLPLQHPWRLARAGRLARGKILPPPRRLQLQPGRPRTAYRMEVRAGLSGGLLCASGHFHLGQRARTPLWASCQTHARCASPARPLRQSEGRSRHARIRASTSHSPPQVRVPHAAARDGEGTFRRVHAQAFTRAPRRRGPAPPRRRGGARGGGSRGGVF